MEKIKLKFSNTGELKLSGYLGELTNFIEDFQLKDSETWKLFVNQFKIHSDKNGDWRGEFWGKMMRGASLTYRVTKDEALYKILVETVNDLLSVQEENGRLSTYPIEYEFNGWDIWGRKYVMLGLLYFYDIAKSQKLKVKIKTSLKKQANYIINHIGNGKNKKNILETSTLYGAMNSCSILEAFVKLYEVTEEKKYLDFSKYIIDSGLSKDINLIESCLNGDKYPYQFNDVKAYEMISCFEGLLEYFKVTKEQKYLIATENFFNLLVKTDYTIIGCCGCNSEFLDNSSITQTNKTDEIMQETCVTVTLIKLCAKLLSVTGDIKYVKYIEQSSYNALFGSVNDSSQTMKNAKGNVWTNEGCHQVPHEAFPFDSYSPLVYGKRGKQIGGFMVMQNGRSYGCCACIGSAGLAITGLTTIMESDKGYFINLYNTFKFTSIKNDKTIKINCYANLYKENVAKIIVDGKNEKFKLNLRIPDWTERINIKVDGQEVNVEKDQTVLVLDRIWNKSIIIITFVMPVKESVLNGMVAFKKGPIVLARDSRLENTILSPLSLKIKNDKIVRSKQIKNDKFKNNVTYKIKTDDNVIYLCDYSSAGKNFDDQNSLITVWQDIKK